MKNERQDNGKWPKWVRISLWTLAGFFAFVVLVAIFADPPEEKNVDSEVLTESTAETSKEFICASPDLFREQFNRYAVDAGMKARLPKIEVFKEAPESFQVAINDQLTLNGDLNKDGSLREAVLVTSNDGSPEAVTEQLLSFGGMISAVNPSFVPSDRGRILEGLGLFADGLDLTSGIRKYSENGIAYSVYMVYDALVFSISPEKEKLVR